MKLSAKHFLISGLLLILLVSFYVKTHHIVFLEHQQFDGSLGRLRDLDISLNEDVLKARSNLLDDYDGFPKQIEEMRSIAGNSASIPSFVSENGKQAVQTKMQHLAELLSQKEELLERFKSQNALLKNSLRYLPLAGTELVNQVSKDDEAHDLEMLLNALMRQVLAYSLHPGDDQKSAVEHSLETLKKWREQHQANPWDATLGSLAVHARSITNRKPKVDALTQDLIALSTGKQIDEILGLYNEEFSRVLHTANLYRVGLYVLCGLLVLGIAHTIYALGKANSSLEHRVATRTKDLLLKNEELKTEIAERIRAESEMERMHKKLVDVSRRAGMADVATSVLHNVGNVLNSVNISCSVVEDTVRKSRIGSVSRLATLLHENGGDLAGFLTNDPTGRKLPDFVDKLSHQLRDEQTSLLDELQLLASNIEHIRSVVSMQQSYASVGGVCETLSLQELVEDAIQMNRAALARHGVEVVQEYEPTPPVPIDKHKILQILVNLICNAKHALTDSGREDKRLTVRVAMEGGQIKICIDDNGIGIPEENLPRIFSHGFTTKKNGHGFGLHSGVLAVQEMGGRLSVQSAGLGAGATFTLELPLEIQECKAA